MTWHGLASQNIKLNFAVAVVHTYGHGVYNTQFVLYVTGKKLKTHINKLLSKLIIN